MLTSKFQGKAGSGKKFHFDNLFWDDPQVYESIDVYQIGDLCCESDFVLGPHKQLCYEISYITSGKGEFMTDGKWYPVQAGDIYVNLPDQTHDIRADKIEPFRYFYIGFNFNYYTGDQNPFLHIKKMFDHITYPIVKDRLNIEIPFLGTFNEMSKATEYSNIMVKTYVHQIIVLAYRNFYDDWQKEYTPDKNIDNIKYLTYQIISYVDTNIYHIQELPQIAEELGYSYSYLSHIFSQETGLTIQQYYNQKRFEMATELLKKGELTITEIAEKLHYQSIHSFSKAFRKTIGVPPAQYQNLHKNNQKNRQRYSKEK